MTKSIEVNEDAIQPKDYFKIVKGKFKTQTKDKLEKQLKTIAQNIIAAKKVGQTAFLHKLAFTYDIVLKEQVLLSSGFKKYVHKEDVQMFIDKVQPKNSVKIIELERFPRAIPMKNLKDIQKAKDLEIFDDFCVVFTDFTDNDYQTKEEKDLIKKNRDPIVFGYFKHEKSGLRHDRFYLVTDWQDEYCELDFASMIEKMSKQGIKNPEKDIAFDEKYLNEIVIESLYELEGNKKQAVEAETPKLFWQRVFGR